MSNVATQIRVIDADTHLTEPPDLWTSRMPPRFRSEAPSVQLHEETRTWRWRIGDRWCSLVGNYSTAGWKDFYPSCPPSLDEADPACFDAKARLALMDRYGIYAQVLYPNVIAFEGHAFMALRDDELKLACVQTYNDYQAEFASVAPDRFILLAMMPFWDLEASIRELRRCHQLGHRAMLWASTLDRHGLPDFTDPHWYPLYSRILVCPSTFTWASATPPTKWRRP
jgi:predicted TIM-barrel fold metal-dependent hydrolase